MREEVGALPSGSYSKAKVRYRRLTGADNISRSPVPNSVLEDVTNVIQASHCQESAPETQSNSVQCSEVLDTANLNSVVLSYIEMSQYRVEKVLSTIRDASAALNIDKSPMQCSQMQASICDKSDIIECRNPRVGVIGHEKKLTFKSVNSIVCDLSQRFYNVEDNGKRNVGSLNTSNDAVAVGDETRSQPDSKLRFHAAQPLQRSKRFRMLGSLGLSEPGKNNVEKFRGQSSVSFQSQDWKENIDPRSIDDGVLRHEKKLTFKSVNSIVCDLSQQVVFTITVFVMNGCDVNCKVAGGDETRSQRDRKLSFDATQPLRRSKRFKLFSSLGISEPGKNNVEKIRGQSSVSSQSQALKENIDPDCIDDGVNDDDMLTNASVSAILQPQQIQNLGLVEIERILHQSGRSLSDWSSMPQP
ncbi:hypothetical protein RIF29_39179 [Crotalaria pallida]|uniref:Uncharacterized protein n=1 Tax=Crotalaria pallida TaxID=3830 RepID=A0AAN9E3R3_CROPI